MMKVAKRILLWFHNDFHPLKKLILFGMLGPLPVVLFGDLDGYELVFKILAYSAFFLMLATIISILVHTFARFKKHKK